MAITCFLVLIMVSAAETQSQTNNLPLFEKLRVAGFSDKEILKVFLDERVGFYPGILIKKAKGLDYFDPRFGLLAPKSIERGKKILKEQKSVLEKVEQNFGVEREILISLFRLETNFGQYLGEYRVFNSFYTFFAFKRQRWQWAEKELVNLMVFCRSNRKDPLEIKGSWAGAFGLWQFIPSSVLNFAVDGNGDGEIDLFGFEDGIFSAANYLKNNGWRKDNALEKNRRAIFAYNHCLNYVKATVIYAKAIGFK